MTGGRLLLVSNTPFLPATAGNRERIRQLLGWLVARGWEASALLLPDLDFAAWDVAGMRRMLGRVDVAEAPPRRLLTRVAGRLRRARPSPEAPLDVDAWCPPWFRRRVATAVAAERFDVVLVQYVFLTACLDGLGPRRPFAVVDTQDLMHRRRDTYAAAGVPLQWFHTTREEEARGLARVDLVLAISEDEARVLRTMAADVLTVPHASEVVRAPLSLAAPGRVVYVASHNDLNVAAYRWLAQHVWPAVRAAVPAAELLVYGTVCEKLGPPPAGVVIGGVVERLDEAYARARVVVNPAPSGTGLPIKTVEALCHGRPVVATPAGSGGITGGVLTVADAPGFAAAIRQLLEADETWAARAAEAAATAASRFGPDAVFGPLEARLRAAIRR